ncbi:type I CRISPR-associated protein Cas8a1/Csx8 [Fusobacterium sp. MFO224]|uniref:type I CRISPR-associated protein Cas8a1/Csx8 n=1 Tax=Fusobacterium sp. MFO224 TaxID=3378070 RepID=UPI003854CE26
MVTNLKNNFLKIEPSDWRWSATIVGLMKYFKNYNLESDVTVEDDFIEFDSKLLNDEKYLKFAEKHFKENMHHKKVEELISIEKPSEEVIKEVNEKLSKNASSNTVMLKTFKGIKYDGTNSQKIQKIIDENRLNLIEQTFRGGRALYFNFCNENNLLKDSGKSCRIRGYSLDMGKKGKSVSYMGDQKTFVYEDSKLFDFIPFAFSLTRETFFVNNNFTIKQLLESNRNDIFEKENNIKSDLFFKVKESSRYINYDAEIIRKDRENEYFETLYLRKNSIKRFEKIDKITLDAITKSFKLEKYRGNILNEVVNKDGYLNIQNIVVNCIVNNLRLDDLIDVLLREENKSYIISHLININIGGSMNLETKKTEQKKAIASAIGIRQKFLREGKQNKLRAYEQRFISAITLKDYDRVKELLLHISATTQQALPFINILFEDFEENKDIAYTFINALGEKKIDKNKGGNE